MTTDKDRQLEHCKIRCPRCGYLYDTSLEVDFCSCTNCGQHLVPKKHVVADSENEVN